MDEVKGMTAGRPDDDAIRHVLKLRGRQYLQYQRLAQRVREISEEVASEHLIRCTVQHRVKSAERLEQKLVKWREKGKLDGLLEPMKILGRIGDIAAVRVTTYLDRDRDRMVDRLRARLMVDKIDRKEAMGSLYRAIHLEVRLADEELEASEEDRCLQDMSCEIQVCTLLSHVYSEIEHDLRYKPLSGALGEDEERLLDALGHLTVTGDQIILSLIERTEQRVRELAHSVDPGVVETPPAIDLMAALAPKLGFLSAPRDNASSVLGLLALIGLQTATDIEQSLLDDQAALEWQVLTDRVGRSMSAGKGTLGTKAAPFSPDSADGLLLLAVHRVPDRIRAMLAERGPGRPPRAVGIVDDLLPILQGESSERPEG